MGNNGLQDGGGGTIAVHVGWGWWWYRGFACDICGLAAGSTLHSQGNVCAPPPFPPFRLSVLVSPCIL
eukprot:153491-Chlamydomonas_euryale.AAC.1